jgi:hypothetical protein
MLMEKTAVISPDGKYRYLLTRRWGMGEMVTWVMLNPSIADAEIDDMTITKCIGFSRRWNMGGMRVVNLYALRATDPRTLKQDVSPTGPENMEHIRLAISNRQTPFVVAAWGASLPWPTAPAIAHVKQACQEAGRTMLCLGKTKDGSPRHPGRLSYDIELETYGG